GFFFFSSRRRHTRFSRDWSSDVCSSDLPLDMFAWGCTMAFAANGVPPFGGDSVPAIMRRVLHEEPDLGALAGELRELVAACLAKEPRSRPTAVEVLRRLLGAEAGADLLAEGSSAATLTSPPATSPSADSVPAPRPPDAVPGPLSSPEQFPAPPGPGPAQGFPRPGPPPPGYPVAPPARRQGGRPLLVVGAALAAVLLTAAGIAGAVLLRDGDRAGGEQPVAGSSPTASSAASPAAAARGCSYEP